LKRRKGIRTAEREGNKDRRQGREKDEKRRKGKRIEEKEENRG
jgi:hypothetical protein